MDKNIAAVMLIGLLFYGCLPVAVTAQANWLEGYGRRMLFYWQSSSAGQDSFTIYNQTGINQNSKFYIYNETQADFRDIRVTLTDGTTQLSIWNQTTHNSLNCTVWVKFPAANQSYYLYWNNPTANVEWNTNVFYDYINGVVASYQFNESSQTDIVIDYSLNANNGTPSGTTITAGYWPNSNAREFDGSGDFLNLINGDTTLSNAFSVVWLAKRNSTLTFDIVLGTTTPNNSEKFGYYSGANTSFVRVVNGGSLATPVCSPVGSWEFITITRDDNNKINYAVNNGSFSRLFSDVAQSGNFLFNRIGTDGSNDFGGVIGGLFVFDTALSLDAKNNICTYYPDCTIERGKVLVRQYFAVAPNVSLFGVVESATDPDFVSGQDAVGVGVAFGVIVLGVCVALIFSRKK